MRRPALALTVMITAILSSVAAPPHAVGATWDVGCSIPTGIASGNLLTTMPCHTEADGHELPTADPRYLPTCWRVARPRIVAGCYVVMSPLRMDDAPAPSYGVIRANPRYLRSLLELVQCNIAVASNPGTTCRVYFQTIQSAAL
jgi:hypothetical protein